MKRWIAVFALVVVGTMACNPRESSESLRVKAEARVRAEWANPDPPEDSSPPIPVPAPASAWSEVTPFRPDALTGKSSGFYVTSETVTSVYPMAFPYHDVTVRILIPCDNDVELRFADQPNLTNVQYSPYGNDTTWGQVSFDGRTAIGINFSISGSGKTLYSRDKQLLNGIIGGKEVRIQLRWYGQGHVVFPFDLAGSSEAVANLRERCGS